MARHWIDRTNGEYANPTPADVPTSMAEACKSYALSVEIMGGKHVTDRRGKLNGRLADIAAWSDMRRLVHGKV